jgi:peptidoglycan/LPS O-acetylase OafA/YrhL
MPEASPDYRRDIDGLRAIAVLAVVLHHLAPTAVPGGFAGVDVFFVISGYLITRIINTAVLANEFSYAVFVWRRCRRILPSLGVVLVATLTIGACILTGPELESLARHTVAGALSGSNLLLFSEVGYFDTSAATKPLLHLWSLGIEEQFYLVWPLLLCVLPRAQRTRLLCIGALVALSLMLSENLAYADPSQAFYLLHARAWELGAGGLLALAAPRTHTDWATHTARGAQVRAALSCTGLVLTLLAMAQLNATASWPGLSALAPVTGTVLLIVAGPSAVINRTILSAAPVRWIGQRSYALYLWHWPPLAFLHILAPELQLSADTQVYISAALMLLALVLAHLTVRYVEQPVRRLADRVEARGAIRASSLLPYAVPVASVTVIAAAVVTSHGIPSRYGANSDDALATLRAAAADSATSYHAVATRCRLPDSGHATWCWRVSGNGPGIAVFGDSHAEGVFAALVASEPGVPLLLTGRKGCAPIVQDAPIAERTGEICRRASNLAHATILRDSSIATVLLIARGPAYISGVGFGVDSARPVVPVSTGDSLQLRDAYEAGITRSIDAFLAAGKRVMLVLDAPELGFQPDECVIGRPFGLRMPREPCALPRTVVQRRNAGYLQLVTALQARFPALDVVDASVPFCDATLCHARRGTRLLYSDANHLSAAGTRLLFAHLRPRLAARAPGRSLASARAQR